MKGVAFIGDPHVMGSPQRFGGAKRLGINERGWLTLDVLGRALDKANEVADVAVILGDLVDSMRPEPQLLAELRSTLRRFRGELFVMKGNHDSASAQPGDNAIAVLRDDRVFPVDTPMVVNIPDGPDLLLVPFRAGPILEWLPTVLSELKEHRRDDTRTALCLHAGVKDSDTAPWLQDSSGAISYEALRTLAQQHEVDVSFHGDWHDHRVFEGDVHAFVAHQVGALCPTGFNNLGITEYGNVAVLDRGRVSYFYIPGPRFMQFGLGESPSCLTADGNQYFVEWAVAINELEAAKLQLSALKASGIVIDGSVLPDGEAAQDGMREAARTAKSASSLEEGVANYIDELVLPENVDRQAVHERVRKYLGF